MNFSALKNFDLIAAGFAGIWLVFLIFPLAYILGNDSLAPAQQVLGVCLTLLFSLIYLLSFGAYSLLTEPRPLVKTLYWNLLLLIPTLGIIFLSSDWIFYLATFYVALWAFHTPQKPGIIIGATIAIITIASMICFYWDVFLRGGYGFAMGAGFILLMAMLNYRADLRVQREEEFAKAKQAERIARDVHDILGHTLTVINLKAELALALTPGHPDKARAEMQEVSVLSRTALAEVRATVTRMRNPDLSGELEAARRALETAQIKAHLPEPEAAPLAGNNATLFSWVLREAITNVVRHSSARNCWVSLESERLEVVDDGKGHAIEPQNGLLGLQDRVREAGGDLVISGGNYTRLLATMNGDTSPLASLGDRL